MSRSYQLNIRFTLTLSSFQTCRNLYPGIQGIDRMTCDVQRGAVALGGGVPELYGDVRKRALAEDHHGVLRGDIQ